MSADLFAEFATGGAPPAQHKASQNQDFLSQPSGFDHNLAGPSFGQFGGIQQQPSQSSLSTSGQSSAQPWSGHVHNPGTLAWPTLDHGHGQAQSTGTAIGNSNLNLNQDDDDDDDEGWGDFEVAAPAAQPQPATKAVESQPPAARAPGQSSLAGKGGHVGLEPQKPAPQRTRIVRASTMDLMTNNLLGTSIATSAAEKQAKQPSHQDDFLDWVEPVQESGPSKPVAKPVRNPSDSVLFDVDDYEEGADLDDSDDGDVFDDDFGDFETGATPLDKGAQDLLSLNSAVVPTTKAPGTMSLSNLSISDAPLSRYPAPKSPSFHERNPFPGLSVTTPPADTSKQLGPSSNATPSTAWPSAGVGKRSPTLDDGWGTFEDFSASTTKPVQSKELRPAPKSFTVKPKKAGSVPKTKTVGSDWDWDFDEPEKKKPAPAKKANPAPSAKIDSSWDWDVPDESQPTTAPPLTQNQSNKDDVPPVNIPPPSVLMSIFPQLLSQANTFLFKPTANQPHSIRDRVLSDSKTLDFLRGYTALARVAARIITGRKSRWHRDKFLAQSMSISAAGSKGMKLAGVDKAQTARESREAGDVVDLWKENVGRLRSAVAAVNATIQDPTVQLKLPELAENMHVSTAKDVPTAAKACIICGLKREERVAKVDHTVEDSFGEWWAEHWGHVECKRFWLEHETALRQR